jgi:hypothetical protein
MPHIFPPAIEFVRHYRAACADIVATEVHIAAGFVDDFGPGVICVVDDFVTVLKPYETLALIETLREMHQNFPLKFARGHHDQLIMALQKAFDCLMIEHPKSVAH